MGIQKSDYPSEITGSIFEHYTSPDIYEYSGMPEFVWEIQRPFMKVELKFSTKNDLDEFQKLTGIRITERTKYIWFTRETKKSAGELRYE